MKSSSQNQFRKMAMASTMLRMILMFLLAYIFLLIGSMIVGRTTSWVPLSIFNLARNTQGLTGVGIFALGIFIGESGWVVACFLSGVSIGAVSPDNGKKWGLGVAFSVHAFRLHVLWLAMRQDQLSFPSELFWARAAIFLLILSLSCVSGAFGGYCGEKVAVSVINKYFDRHRSDP